MNALLLVKIYAALIMVNAPSSKRLHAAPKTIDPICDGVHNGESG